MIPNPYIETYVYPVFCARCLQVDRDMRTIRTATANAIANGLRSSTSFVQGRVLPFAEKAVAGGELWDLAIADPPSALRGSRSESSVWSLVRGVKE